MTHIQQERPYVLYSTDTYFMLKAKKPTFSQDSHIKINRLTSKISVLTANRFEQQLMSIDKRVREDLFLVMGVLIVNQQPYLCVVNSVEPVATLNVQKVLCITGVNFIPFKLKLIYNSINQSQNDKILKQMAENIINNNFYFCYKVDLTLTYHKMLLKSNTERKYFWNENMLMMFTHYGLAACWRVPVIQGHVKELYCQNNYFSFYYCIVSRRSKFMSGTRFHSQGIDNNCNVANLVETEQIFICLNYIFTHVSIRGSAPIFWSQAQSSSAIKFSRKDQENINAIQKHYSFLRKQYNSKIIFVNLLSQVKSPEKDLKNRFEFYLYKALPNEPYIYYDVNEQLQEQTSSSKIVDAFIEKHQNALSPNENFLCVQRYSNKIFRQQTIIPRVNCLDCVDRTNFVMSRLSITYLNQIVYFINDHTNMEEKKLQLTQQYKKQIQQLWIELAHRISLLYCGTDSQNPFLKVQDTNSFFSFFTGGFRTLNRLTINDALRQTCIDFLLGQMEEQSKTKYFQDNITRGVIEQTKYCTYQEAVIYVLTWNCNTVDPQKLSTKDKEKLFNFPVEKTDIVVVCLQQMVELNSYNVLLGSNQNIVEIWRQVIEKYLNQVALINNRVFVHLASSDMVGVASFVFVSGTLFNRIYQHSWLQVKTGFKNSLGNKGAIILFLQIDSSYLTITNCHLAAGQTSSTDRQQDIHYIHTDALSERDKRRLFEKSEYRFFIGDLNFRLEAKNQHVREILYTIDKQDSQKQLTKSDIQTYLQSLLQKDEYHLNNTSGPLSMYSEATIYFLPTYKYIKKEKTYDSKRTPSWCDRILFYAQEPSKFIILKYWDVDCFQSDHKPVCGAFKFLLKKQDPDKKKKLMQIYMQQVE